MEIDLGDKDIESSDFDDDHPEEKKSKPRHSRRQELDALLDERRLKKQLEDLMDTHYDDELLDDE
jgi:hypothetical protein